MDLSSNTEGRNPNSSLRGRKKKTELSLINNKELCFQPALTQLFLGPSTEEIESLNFPAIFWLTRLMNKCIFRWCPMIQVLLVLSNPICLVSPCFPCSLFPFKIVYARKAQTADWDLCDCGFSLSTGGSWRAGGQLGRFSGRLLTHTIFHPLPGALYPATVFTQRGYCTFRM